MTKLTPEQISLYRISAEGREVDMLDHISALEEENRELRSALPGDDDPNLKPLFKCGTFDPNIQRPKVIMRPRELYDALKEIHAWLVCAAITTQEDMAQSFEHMEEVARKALGE